jgi:hypothetical protein
MLKPNGDRYELTEQIVHRNCVVPAGYKTDGVSYKLRVFALFVNKFDPRYIKAAVVHDYMVDRGEWELGNKYFEQLLPINDWRATAMIWAVDKYAKWKGYI